MPTLREMIAGLLGGGFLGGIGSLFMLRSKRDNVYSNSAVALSKAYGTQIDGLQRDIGRLDAEMQAMRTERAALLLELAASRDEAAMLRKRVTTLEDELRIFKNAA